MRTTSARFRVALQLVLSVLPVARSSRRLLRRTSVHAARKMSLVASLVLMLSLWLLRGSLRLMRTTPIS